MMRCREPDEGASRPLAADIIAAACRLVGCDRVRSVQIVVGRRLSADELARCHAWAAAAAAALTIDGAGVLTIRPRPAAASDAARQSRRWSWRHWLPMS